MPKLLRGPSRLEEAKPSTAPGQVTVAKCERPICAQLWPLLRVPTDVLPAKAWATAENAAPAERAFVGHQSHVS